MSTTPAGTLTMTSVIQLCRSALWDEIEAIRKKGSKPLLLSDGLLLGEEAEGGYLYSFTLDAEVILPDDAPGKLSTSAMSVDATVISITGFTILLLLAQSIGRTVPSARLVTDASFLLEKLRERLSSLSTDAEATRRAARLFMPSSASATASHSSLPPTAPSVASGQVDTLNRYQQQAVTHVASAEVSFVWGPPGTGKTTTLGHAVAALLRQGESVLVVAHSNAAVDAAAKAVSRQTSALPLYVEGRILRVGVSRTSGLDKGLLPREIVRRQQPQLVQAIEDLERERDQLTQQLACAAGQVPAAMQSRLSDLRKQLQQQRELLRGAERALVAGARCVLCTLSKTAIAEEISMHAFDAAIIDEASMAYIPADAYVASLARRRVAIFGDFRQLPPITQGDTHRIHDWLDPDIFEKAGVVRNVDARREDPRLVMLAEQYRMHPGIARIIARRWYAGQLQTGVEVERQCAAIVAGLPQSGSPVVLVDTAALQPFADKESREQHTAGRRFGGNSRFNLVSAIVAIELALAAAPADSESPISVGIITPYAAQARLIAKLLHDLRVPRERIMCATVHRFQGSERDVIIYDTVEGKPFTRAGRLLTADGSGLEARLLNVALSRAKGKLVIVADLAHLRSVLPADNVYQRVLADIGERVRPLRLAPGANGEAKRETGLAGAKPLPGIVSFSASAGASDAAMRDELAADLCSAEIVAIVGEPSASSALSRQLSALGNSVMAPSAHVYVGAKTLPRVVAQEHRWAGPALPRVALGIDRRILWVEASGYALRIAHHQTVNLLYSLWDLLPESVRTLKTTAQQREQASHGQSPLARACAKCGAQLWVSVEYRRAALRCTNPACGHSASFTPALATQFADLMRVTCPQCAGQLEGKQGQDGVYLRCMNHPSCKGWRRLNDLI